MSAVGMASLGTQCKNKARGMSSLGVHCVLVLVRRRGGRKGKGYLRRITVPSDRTDIPIEQLLREDEELIAIVVAAIHEGILP